MVWLWLQAFILTQVIETPIYAAALRGSLPRRVAVAFAASAITHPIVWFVIWPLVDPYWLMVAVAETFAVVAETVWLRAFGLRRAFAWALLANACSVAAGFAYYELL